MSLADELLSLLRSRRSVRRFAGDPVAREIVEKLIEAAAWAPSAGNRQDWFFTVVTSAQLKAQMSEAVRRCWQNIAEANRDSGLSDDLAQYTASFDAFVSAPVVIAVSARVPSVVQTRLLRETATATSGSAASAAMAAQNLMLAAHALGLATCCLTGALAARDELGRLLALERKRELVCLIALGVAAETPPAPPRKGIAEIARFLE